MEFHAELPGHDLVPLRQKQLAASPALFAGGVKVGKAGLDRQGNSSGTWVNPLLLSHTGGDLISASLITLLTIGGLFYGLMFLYWPIKPLEKEAARWKNFFKLSSVETG
jgi:hypothetical protein